VTPKHPHLVYVICGQARAIFLSPRNHILIYVLRVRYQNTLVSFSHTKHALFEFQQKMYFQKNNTILVPIETVLDTQKIVPGPVLITGMAVEFVRRISVH
jgi:hypothetical protein